MLRSVFCIAGVAVAVAFFAPGLASRYFERAAATQPAAIDVATPVSNAGYGGNVRIPADRNGHYLTEAQVEGRPVNFMVDTGASVVVLRYEDARNLGLVYGSDKFEIAVQTANGIGHVHRIRLSSVRLGSIAFDDVDAVVAEEGMLATNLLGMSFLRRLSRYEVRGETLVLER